MAENVKKLNAEKTVLYSSAQTPPAAPLFFSALQHMLLILSLGMAMPVSIARAAGLDVNLSSSLLAAALFTMGLTGILQTINISPDKIVCVLPPDIVANRQKIW